MRHFPRSRAVLTFACVFAAAFAALPSTAVAQTSSGTVLFSRTAYDSQGNPTGSSIFSIGDNGLNEKQLTPHVDGEYDVPSVAGFYDDWLTNAFNSKGSYSVFLHASYSNQTGFTSGKYFIVSAYGVRTPQMFPGTNDLQDPSVGQGYGSVSWGPANNDQIAYANVADQHTTGAHPSCVRLMQSTGANNHVLWCADRWNYWGIEGIRWAGNGGSLLVYAVTTHDALYSDLYVINASTGAATLVAKNLESPHNGGGAGDISYDGHEVIFQVTRDTNIPPCTPSFGVSWCAKNLQTGQNVALLDPNHVVDFIPEGLARISPDGSQAFLTGFSSTVGESDYELYAVKTDGSGFNQISSPCVALDPGHTDDLIWRPIRVSPDGTRVLANCRHETASGAFDDHIWILSTTGGSPSFVTDNGVAYDWHVQ
ncbi:hypothetical protein [Dyella sp.]|uniref:hypothetical protein n=1 Tax=Dyella sp. TaxID=1869338 RepID=UPI002D79B3A6|nr:hypothetical protein [Dyella sp.]HET7332605.1 hypothetical protein [Dyella sp.]